jgi:hypothetical protein
MMPSVSITKKGKGPAALYQALARIRRSDVLVGIPQFKAGRRGQKINNAALLFIHTHGSPIRGIPKRAVIEPAIEADGNRQAIETELKQAAQAWLNDNPGRALEFLKRAGVAGQTAAKAWFVDPRNNWPPNSPLTIARKGSDRPLIDTGALRKAIVWIVRVTQ